MAFKTLKEQMASLLPGVGVERVEVRTMGCWSCVHWDVEKAAKLWWDTARGKLLERAVMLAMKSPAGEDSQPVRNIRKMIPKIDASITANRFGTCSKGKTATGNPVGDFVEATFLCGIWSGVTGASIAREGEAPDKLPEELMDAMNGPIDPASIDLDDPKLS